jgi:hypothetical protein
MATKLIELPASCIRVLPDLDFLVVCTGHKETERRVEGTPVDAGIVAFHDLEQLDFGARDTLVLS